MRVYDLFPFFNELPLLDLRLHELRNLVTDFGLVELPRTFTDLPKPLYYAETGRTDVRTYMPEAIPSGPHPTVDWFQRAQLGKLLSDAEPDDIVMLSDVDEIPNRLTVLQVIQQGWDYPVCLQQRLYYHRVDLFDPWSPWSGTIIAPRKCLGEEPNMQELRNLRCNLSQVPNGGWHFSWLGNEVAIANKLMAVDIERDSDDQMKNPGQDLNFLRSCYETGVDLFGRKEHDKIDVPIAPGILQPYEIEPWLEKYPEYRKQ